MKTPTLVILLVIALAANAWLLRPHPAASPPTTAALAHPAPAASAPLAWSALATKDLVALATKLRNAALPPHLARALLAAEIDEQFRLREESLRGPRKKLKYWQTEPPLSVATRAALLALHREKSRVRTELLGPDFVDAADDSNPLPLAKRTPARLINEDYAATLRELRSLAGIRGTLLPAERAQLTALENDQRQELAALLTPAELADFDAHYSPATQALRYSLFGMAPTETEFRAVLAARLAIEDEMRGTDKPVAQSVDFLNREDLRTKLNDAVRAALGDARFADYQRAGEGEFQMLARFASRGGATLDQATQTWTLRTSATQESVRISEDQALSDDQKADALKALAATTHDRAGALIGPEAAAAYLKSPSASWFAYIDQGWAVTLQYRGMGMRPVSPAAKASSQRPRPAATSRP
jgi:hypothetical protein